MLLLLRSRLFKFFTSVTMFLATVYLVVVVVVVSSAITVVSAVKLVGA